MCVWNIWGLQVMFLRNSENNLLHSLGIIANIGFKVNDVKTKEAEKKWGNDFKSHHM